MSPAVVLTQPSPHHHTVDLCLSPLEDGFLTREGTDRLYFFTYALPGTIRAF